MWHRTRTVYLDYAAATPVRKSVLRAMAPYWSEVYANPSAIHAPGRRARQTITEARQTIAQALRTRPEEITFTSGGTEANNLALFGVVEAAHHAGRAYEDIEIISTKIEHPSILMALNALAQRGVVITYVPVDSDGLIVRAAVAEALSEKTLLVSFAYANSEVGVVQEVKRLVRTVRSARGNDAYVHIDASQAPLWLPCAIDSLGVDLMTLDAGKCYGPKGVGVLAHRTHVPLAPLLYGGDQEAGVRPGTENVPLVVGCAEAIRIAQEKWGERSARIVVLRDQFLQDLQSVVPGVLLNGPRTQRLANNLNISIAGVDGEFAVVALDTAGVAASTRSACASTHGGRSHVVYALSGDEARAASTIRFTLGEETTPKDLQCAVSVLKTHCAMVQNGVERLD